MMELQWRHPLISLQEMSLLRIATTICNNRQLLRLLLKCPFYDDFDNRLYVRQGKEWAAVEAKAKELISQVCNCQKLNRRMIELVWPVYYRIMRWKSIYVPFIGNRFLLQFHWTDQGRVDTIKTARHLIGNKAISMRKRFVLACAVCLSQEISEIWKEMSHQNKNYFLAENSQKLCPMLRFWAHTMEGSENVLENFLRDACTCAFENGLLEALKYLFSLSTKHARDDMAYVYMQEWVSKFNAICFREENEIDIGYFLYFEIDETIFLGHFSVDMSLLLRFSEHGHFFDVLTERLKNLSWQRDVLIFLYHVFFNFHLEVIKDHNLGEIFIHTWRNIPTSKKGLVNSDLGGHFFTVLVRDNFPFLAEEEAFKTVSRLASSDSKFCAAEMPFGFHEDKWKILNFLIEEEIATMHSLQIHKEDEGEEVPVFNKIEWSRILRFVRKTINKSLKQAE